MRIDKPLSALAIAIAFPKSSDALRRQVAATLRDAVANGTYAAALATGGGRLRHEFLTDVALRRPAGRSPGSCGRGGQADQVGGLAVPADAGRDGRRAFHEHVARPLEMPDQALGGDPCHGVVGMVHPLAAAEA